MHLTPTEQDRLLVFTAAELARRRLAAGVLLNVPESIALICDTVLEEARRGGRHADALRAGQSALRRNQVLPEVPYVVHSVSVEAVFTDGSRLVVVPSPFGPNPPAGPGDPVMPGLLASGGTAESEVGDDPPTAGRVVVEVLNTAPVPVSVTSHFHFFETNPRLRFDRAAAYGMHLDVPAGTHVRFEPGATERVRLRPIAGHRVVVGFAGLVDGALDAPGAREAALERARACGFLDTGGDPQAEPAGAAARALASVHKRSAGPSAADGQS